jgi:DNA-binding NarL/FixJ family response regulator
MGTVVSGLPGPVAAVFLLAENRLLREALLRILAKKENIHIAGAGSFGPGVLEQIVSTGANVLVLDTLSPLLAAQGLVQKLHHLNPGIGVVMVGMEAENAIFLRVVQAGALGYVLKDASALEVARTIRAVAAGEAVCPAALSVALFRWVAKHKPALPSSHLKNTLGLSLREQQLVGLIQQGLTNKEMARRFNLSEQTVKNHVHRILRKVGAPDRLSIGEICGNNALQV